MIVSAITLTLTVPTLQAEFPYQQVDIAIAGGIAEPQDLLNLHLPDDIDWSIGVILNGRAPIWVYAYLVHECHAAAWVACRDPRLGGAIVVQSHRKGVNVGTVVLVT
jgi:CRISPR-associated protein Csx3